MSDLLRSYIRTAVPVVLGALASVLVAAALRWLGYDLDPGVALGLVTAATIVVVYGLGRALEKSQYALFRGIGRFLLTLGADIGQPVYVKPDPEPTPSTLRSRY